MLSEGRKAYFICGKPILSKAWGQPLHSSSGWRLRPLGYAQGGVRVAPMQKTARSPARRQNGPRWALTLPRALHPRAQLRQNRKRHFEVPNWIRSRSVETDGAEMTK